MNDSKFRNSLIGQVEDILKSIKPIFEHAEKDKLNWRPAVNKWSVAEHLDHINRIIYLYIKQIDIALKNDSAGTPNNEYNPRLFGRMFAYIMEPPPKFKMKTFKMFAPKLLDLSQIEKEFGEQRNKLIDRINTAAAENKFKNKLRSPASKLLRFEIGEAFLILTAHDRRHLFSINNTIRKF